MDFENSQYYTNRELSWIQFNYRLLEEARDKSNPLFERLKFLSITSSNLDEFLRKDKRDLLPTKSHRNRSLESRKPLEKRERAKARSH